MSLFIILAFQKNTILYQMIQKINTDKNYEINWLNCMWNALKLDKYTRTI